jgi:hypothetical protein
VQAIPIVFFGSAAMRCLYQRPYWLPNVVNFQAFRLTGQARPGRRVAENYHRYKLNDEIEVISFRDQAAAALTLSSPSF